MGFDSSRSSLRRTTLLLTALSLLAETRARTNTFDDDDEALSYDSAANWSVESEEEAFRKGVHSTTASGAALRFGFAGE
mgnify:FL=1